MSHTTRDLPNLDRTIQALKEFDAFKYSEHPGRNASGMTTDELVAEIEEKERLGIAVARAFGLDTADRNNMDACLALRPGPKVPSPGYELSFLRRMVALHKEK